MPNPSIFGAGVQGRSRAQTAQRRVNCVYEVEQAPDRSTVTILGRPGLVLHADLGETAIRGEHVLDPYQYVVHRDSLYRIANNGTATDLGTLDTSVGRVYFADNGDQIALVDGTAGYTYTVSTGTFAKITDGDLPTPDSITFINNYFIVNSQGTGQWFISALNDATSWDALDFTTADSDPDDVVALLAHQGVLAVFGTESFEAWGFTGDAAFPFARTYGMNQEWGLEARASLRPLANDMFGLLRNDLGEVVVGRVTLGGVEVVSPPNLVRTINDYTVTSDAVGAAFMWRGHLLYALSFPSEKRCWVYSTQSRVWHEWENDAGEAWEGLGCCAVNRNVYFSGRTDGKIYKLDGTVNADNGAVLPLELVSRHLHDQNRMMACSRLELDMDVGPGLQSGQGSNPKAMLQVSRDRGKSWGVEHWTDIGKVGEYLARPAWRRLGRGRDLTFRLRITDPVQRVILGERLTLNAGRR